VQEIGEFGVRIRHYSAEIHVTDSDLAEIIVLFNRINERYVDLDWSCRVYLHQGDV